MPYISTTTTKKLSDSEKETLQKALGEMISIFPGKSERWLMLSISDGVKMCFGGDDSLNCAFVEVKIFGNAPENAYDRFTEELCGLFERSLSIPRDRVYVRYEESFHWGWNGANF